MTTADINERAPRKPLRLWPGVVLATVLVLGRYVAPLFVPDVEIGSLPLGLVCIFAGIFSAFGIILWWLFFSRAPWLERLAAILLIAIAVFGLRSIVHASILGGNMGHMVWIYSLPILCLALVMWAIVSRHLSTGARRLALVAAMVIASVPMVLIRTGGVSGVGAELHWRWTPTPEELLLAQVRDEPAAPPPAAVIPPASGQPTPAPPAADAAAKATPAAGADASKTAPSAPPAATAEPTSPAAATTPAPATTERSGGRAEWPGFRGPARDSVVRGARIETDWSKTPPKELWRRPIGPGWSSFAVSGDLIYTQEQRGEEEMVSAYSLKTGQPVWRHKDTVRFWESNAGAGPRGTPTIHHGRIYTVGAKGLVNALDAATGARIWSHDAVADTGKTIPEWGIASSALVVDDLVIIAVAGQLIAYDAATGKQRWMGEKGGGGYSSPHFTTIDGVPQVLLIRGSRTISVAPADGKLLWEHTWVVSAAILQPALVGDRDLLIASHDGMVGLGMKRLHVTRKPDGWSVEERWTSRGLKPYFSDVLIHNGHAFGVDGSILSCISLDDGARKWKGGRYGGGQLVLLPDQDVMLVLSEEGELALVKATADQFTELARFKAIEGKTWNHPVVVGDVVLVRNGEEMAAFRLPSAAGATTTSDGEGR